MDTNRRLNKLIAAQLRRWFRKSGMDIGVAVLDLVEKHGTTLVGQAWAAISAGYTYHGYHESGLRKSSGHCCLRLVGRHNCRENFQDCTPPGSDHSCLWLKDGKPHQFITEPYGLGINTLTDMVAYATKYGLVFRIDASSPHYQGNTIRVIWESVEGKRKRVDEAIERLRAKTRGRATRDAS
jgi:hypothetical protein